VKRPDHIFICGHRVRILPMAEQADDTVGYCKSRLGEIYLCAELQDDQWTEILFHEATHFISDTHGLGLTEEQVYSLSNGFYSMGLRLPEGRGKC
jgi:hypothetical protein